MSRLSFLSFFVLLMSFFPQAVSAKSVSADGREVDGLFLQASLSSSKTTVGGLVLYEVAVISPISSISLMRMPSANVWGALHAKGIGSDASMSHVRIKGKDMYRAVIARYWLSSSEAGRFKVPSGEYVIGVAKERLVRDPFFGAMRSSYYEPVKLLSPSLDLKVESLPKPPASFPFSGAVGEFEVSVWIPEGYIAAGQEAVAVVTVSGKGSLEGVEIPSLQGAFSSDARLKSVSEERSQYVREGELWSEIELEVTFVPHPDAEGVSRIGPVEFGFYSPEKGKYVRVASEALDVPLGGSSKKNVPTVGIGV